MSNSSAIDQSLASINTTLRKLERSLDNIFAASATRDSVGDIRSRRRSASAQLLAAFLTLASTTSTAARAFKPAVVQRENTTDDRVSRFGKNGAAIRPWWRRHQ